MHSKILRGTMRISALIGVLLLAGTAFAQTSLIFERAKIRVDATPSAKEIKENAPPRPSIDYHVELRPESALNLEYIHTLNTLTPTTGVVIAFTAPSIVTLPLMNVYTPVDVLFVAEDGTILQIMPEVVLGQISPNVSAKAPIQALLFLKSGEALARGIRPRDVVAGSMFTPTPAVQE
jgi:uncharacterized protein